MAKSKKKQKKYSSSSSSDSSSDSSSSPSSSSSSSDDRSKRNKKRKHQKSQKKSKHGSSRRSSSQSMVSRPMPSTAPKPSIGPVLPPHLVKNSDGDAERGPDTYGPVLPNSQENKANHQIGPALPPHMLKPKIVAGPPPPVDDGTHGPSLPPNLLPGCTDNDDDGDIVGPLPEGMSGDSSSQRALEMRALILKHEMNTQKSSEDDGSARREAWMLELPPETTVNLGLGPRTFRAKEGPDMSNRSDWTDTPADKLVKQRKRLVEGEPPPDPEEKSRRFLIAERDKTMEQMIDKCKKSKKHKRDKSLMELHQEKLKKKQKKKDKERGHQPPERRPFDRDLDLQANRFDEAQRKKILSKAQLLNSRFSLGEAKFL